jgi:hypothetical protein
VKNPNILWNLELGIWIFHYLITGGSCEIPPSRLQRLPCQSDPVKRSPTKSSHPPSGKGIGKETVKFLTIFDHVSRRANLFCVPFVNFCKLSQFFVNFTVPISH